MGNPSYENHLMDRHYATLILRLTLDQQGRLIQGEMVDVTDTYQERFIGDHGLNHVIHKWLTRQQQSITDNP